MPPENTTPTHPSGSAQPSATNSGATQDRLTAFIESRVMPYLHPRNGSSYLDVRDIMRQAFADFIAATPPVPAKPNSEPAPAAPIEASEEAGDKLRIVAAAVIHGGVVHTAPHHHLAMWQISCCWGEKAHGDQGFVASDGKFYGREAAYVIAKNAGQIRFPLNYEHDELYSEELWSYADWLKEHKMGDHPDASPAQPDAQGSSQEVGAVLSLLYARGYREGHEDTVEARYTDVHLSDRETYFADNESVLEAVAALATQSTPKTDAPTKLTDHEYKNLMSLMDYSDKLSRMSARELILEVLGSNAADYSCVTELMNRVWPDWNRQLTDEETENAPNALERFEPLKMFGAPKPDAEPSATPNEIIEALRTQLVTAQREIDRLQNLLNIYSPKKVSGDGSLTSDNA